MISDDIHEGESPVATSTAQSAAAADPFISRDRALSIVFVVAVFLSSTLLFLVQPLVARLLLPLVGGSSALWNTAMVFFQVALLLGYAYAHGSLRRAGTRRHTFLQFPVLLLPLVVLPLSVPSGWTLPAGVAPSIWVLGVLAIMVGLPFFALATTSPTLQVWFSSTDHPRAADPYFLYAAGNIGSVLALLGYPFVLEPLFSLKAQTRIWAAGYVLFVLACAAAGMMTRRRVREDHVEAAEQDLEPLATTRRLRWLFWGFVPSALMLGVTLHISTDLASFPLLWVVPLLLYLVTFIIAFGKDSLTRTKRTTAFVLMTALPLVLLVLAPKEWNLYVLAAHLVWFFAGALLCHSKLADDRPAAGHLTEFFLILSIGGALGGIFASLIAPQIFVTVVEYPIAISLVLLAAVSPERQRIPKAVFAPAGVVLVGLGIAFVLLPNSMLTIGIVGALLLTVTHGPRAGIAVLIGLVALSPSVRLGGDVVERDRSFFGVYMVRDGDAAENARVLISGTTAHGMQLLDQDGPPRPTSYYYDGGPVGEVMHAIEPQRVAVVGLGGGTVAAYGSPGDEYIFYEIDQTVVDIAEDPDLFTYLSETEADVEVVVDDGRHGLDVSAGDFDLIMIDAFGSDAIPVHLLTKEAMQMYVDRLAPGGTVMVHISNRHFDLRQVVANGAEAAGSQAFGYSYVPEPDDVEQGAFASFWTAIPAPGATPAWMDSGLYVPLSPGGTLWTDDYSNVLSVLSFGG